MFIRKKIVRGVAYYALVESYRCDSKPRQMIILSLGRCSTINEAIADAEQEIALMSDVAEKLSPKRMGPGSEDIRMMFGDYRFYSHNSALRRTKKAQERLSILRSVKECDL